MWAKGQDSPYDDGTGGHQVYGVHPFMLVQGSQKGDFFGMFFRNSNAQSPLLRYNSDGSSTLSYITTGGNIEVYFFIHGSAREIVQAYHNIIGHPNLPPFWSMGWQQASWKYQTQQDVMDVVNGYNAKGMPLEVVWLDIPYLDGYADFSVNTTAFPDLKNYINDVLHQYNQKIVVILDAGLSADDPNNVYYQAAQKTGSLIQSTINKDKYNGALVMHVWPNQTVFMDWFNPNASEVWNQGLSDLYGKLPFDGIWIDMNEATGFCSGECPYPNAEDIPKFLQGGRVLSSQVDDTHGNDTSWFYSYTDQSQMSTYYLPFIPGFYYGGNLDNMSMSLNATHPSINETEYNLHNLYGLMMAKTTFNFLISNVSGYQNYDYRAFVLSRSTFSGSGQYTSHWLGDNWRNWTYMAYSIAGIMNMNMFGIPQAGADVCGFFGQYKDDEMCARWIQLATFYPFARAHQNLTWKGEESEHSEPYLLSEPWITIANASMYDRLQYVRHIYTCLFEVSQWGGSCFDPLFYHFPDDDNCFSSIEESFIIGSALKVSPILEPNVTTYDSYFPAGVWVSMRDFGEIIDTSAGSGGQKVTLTAGLTVNVHLMPGAIIPFQNNSDHSYNSTHQLVHEAPIALIVNRDQSSMASGTLFLDQGTNRSELGNNTYEYYQLVYSSKSLNKFFARGTKNSQSYNFDELVIVNAQDLSDTDFACFLDDSMAVTNLTALYDEKKKTLSIQKLNPVAQFTFSDFRSIHFGNSAKDINLCSPYTYQYSLKNQMVPDLTGSNSTFYLTHDAGILPEIQVDLQLVNKQVINIFWTFTELPYGARTPFQVPSDIINVGYSIPSMALSQFVTISDSPFQLQVHTLSGINLLNITGLIYDSFLNTIQVSLNTTAGDQFNGIMGLGERVSDKLFYDDGVYSMWSRDVASPNETGNPPGNNMYGTHPFYMYKTDSNIWTGVYTNLASAQDWYIKNNNKTGQVNLTTVAIGGVVDMFVILESSPLNVASQFWQTIVGNPVLIPHFALGWNQCKWGYKDTQELRDVVSNYSYYNIPLDTQWSDIDYLGTYRDFEIDQVWYADLPEFVDTLHNHTQHYVPIIDAGIAMRPWGNYSIYTSGVEQNVFVTLNNEILIANVWPNQAAFPDWFSTNTSKWWQSGLSYLHNTVGLHFDGLWLDMNEASDFCGGTCSPQKGVDTPMAANLKYIPTNRYLEDKSMPLDAMQYGGVAQFDSHSLFGAMEVRETAQWFLNVAGNRPFIIERSSFSGMGKYGSRWLGDNFSKKEYMGYSVPGVMSMGLFGIPLSGVDICGFIGDTTPELCARWTVVGSFYPFSRNHNNYGDIPQEPYQGWFQVPYEGTITYTDIMRMAIRNKYHLIRYYYTQFVKMSIQASGPFFNPLFFYYPDDILAYNDVKYNVMLGPGLKLSVLTDQLDQNATNFYFPAGIWCNVWDGSDHCFNTTQGETVSKQTKAYDFYVHIVEGNIVPMQNATSLNINTTTQLQWYPVDFHILGKVGQNDYAWQATGEYINDDGVSISTIYLNHYLITAQANKLNPTNITMSFSMMSKALQNATTQCYDYNANDYLGDIHIYNAYNFAVNLNYTVNFLMNDGTATTWNAVYDGYLDRLIVQHDPKQPICMPNVKSAQFNSA